MIQFNTRINNLLLDVFNAKLLDYQVGDSPYNNGYIFPPSAIFPISLKATKGLRTITVSLDFNGDTRHEIELAISNMKAILHQGADILLPDGFYYYSVYENCSVTKEVAPWIVNVQFTMLGVRHGAQKTKKLSQSGNVFNEGNSETPAIFKITSTEKTVSINDITINNFSDSVIINGIEKTVISNGSSKFADTNITAFPILKSGVNYISVSQNTVLEISYFPIYL